MRWTRVGAARRSVTRCTDPDVQRRCGRARRAVGQRRHQPTDDLLDDDHRRERGAVARCARGTAGPFAPGAPVSVVAPFTDDGKNDTHTATVDWGDLSTSPATVTECGGSGSLAATHVLHARHLLHSRHDRRRRPRRGQRTTVIVNSPPAADAGGPYAGPRAPSRSRAPRPTPTVTVSPSGGPSRSPVIPVWSARRPARGR